MTTNMHEDGRQPPGPPRLAELLSERGSREPASCGGPRPVGDPVSWRKTSSSVGRTRSTPATATPAATIAGRSSRAARAGSLTVTRTAPWSTATSVAQARRPEGRRRDVRPPRPGPAPGRPGRSAGRSGRGARRAGPRPRAGRDRGSRSGRRPARRRPGRGSRTGRWPSVAQLGDEGQQVAPALRVERADGLVEDEHRRPVDERLGDPEPLAHPARVGADPPVGGVGQPDLARGPRRRVPRGSARPARGAGRRGRPARGRSTSRSSAGPGRGTRSARSAAASPSGTPATVAEPPVGRARPTSIRRVVVLPGPVRTEQAEDGARGDVEVEPVERDDPAGIALGEPAAGDRRAVRLDVSTAAAPPGPPPAATVAAVVARRRRRRAGGAARRRRAAPAGSAGSRVAPRACRPSARPVAARARPVALLPADHEVQDRPDERDEEDDQAPHQPAVAADPATRAGQVPERPDRQPELERGRAGRGGRAGPDRPRSCPFADLEPGRVRPSRPGRSRRTRRRGRRRSRRAGRRRTASRPADHPGDDHREPEEHEQPADEPMGLVPGRGRSTASTGVRTPNMKLLRTLPRTLPMTMNSTPVATLEDEVDVQRRADRGRGPRASWTATIRTRTAIDSLDVGRARPGEVLGPRLEPRQEVEQGRQADGQRPG